MSGTVIKFDASPIRPPSGTMASDNLIFCPCDFRCDFEEKVFSSAKGDGIENDFSDFLIQKITPSDTVSIEIIKNGVTLTTVTNDDYGNFYNGFGNQPLYVGWLADWTLIFDAFSGGRYQIKITTTVLGETSVFLSRYFRLNTFDILSADKTVKLETFQNGNLENSEFDFTNLLPGGWPSSIRLFGEFGKMQSNLERDIYQDTSYREIQNRDTVIREYRLAANLVPETIYNRITTKDLLANEILVTSYSVLQDLKYLKFPVVADSFNESRYDNLGNTHFEITFSDRQKNIIKTNVS